jgi:uncharacterized protein (DUF736 family)
MATIGTFRKTENGGNEGVIKTLAVQAEVIFEPVERKSEKATDFRISSEKTRYELGAAWHTISTETGAEYESIKLDDPRRFATWVGGLHGTDERVRYEADGCEDFVGVVLCNVLSQRGTSSSKYSAIYIAR